MKTPEAIAKAAKRYIEFLDNEIKETQFARDNAQRDSEHFTARTKELDGRIKQMRADQKALFDFFQWLAKQEEESE